MFRFENRFRAYLKLLPLILFACIFSTQASAVDRVKYRGELTPTCSSDSESLKFADLWAEGTTAVQGSYQCRGVFIYNITDPEHPTLYSRYNPGNNIQFLEAIIVNGRGYFGSGNGSNGVHIVDLSNPASPVLLGRVNSTTGGGYNTIHEMVVIQQNGATLLIENSNSFGTRPLRVINVTNPAAPVFVRNITPQEPIWIHAMHVRGNRMFTSGWGSNSQSGQTEIWDISNLTTQAPTRLGGIIDSTAVTAGNNMHSSWSSEDGNYLYSCREIGNSSSPSPGDVRVYDIRDPANPLLIRKISMADLGINASTPHNPVVLENKLYVSWYHAGLQVFDLADPTNPRKIGEYDTYAPAFTKEQQLKQLEEIAQFDDPTDIVCGRSLSSNAAISGYEGAWAAYAFKVRGDHRVLIGDLAKGLIIVDIPGKNRVSDFDADGKTDYSVFKPTSGDWEIETSSDTTLTQSHFGLPGDVIVTGDYDGDGNSDAAVFRPSTGIWYMQVGTGEFESFLFGTAGDIPVAADFDGDSKTDIAVWRPSTGTWYIQRSTLGFEAIQWGVEGDKPLTGDYDGDGNADVTVYRPSNGFWYVLRSSNGAPLYQNFGLADDRPLAGDFDGNGVTDFAVFRPSTGFWYIMDPAANAFVSYNFGVADDRAIPADYDGDGRTDVAVYRPGTGEWFTLNSASGTVETRVFGSAGDLPSPASVQPE